MNDAANDNARPLHPAVAAFLAEVDARIEAERAEALSALDGDE